MKIIEILCKLAKGFVTTFSFFSKNMKKQQCFSSNQTINNCPRRMITLPLGILLESLVGNSFTFRVDFLSINLSSLFCSQFLGKPGICDLASQNSRCEQSHPHQRKVLSEAGFVSNFKNLKGF